jgi:membrane protein
VSTNKPQATEASATPAAASSGDSLETQATDETPAAPTQTETGWRKSLEELANRVTSIVPVRVTLAVMDTAGQAGAGLFSAALAFTTLFAVFPLMLLFGGILGWLIQDPAQREALLLQLVSYFPPIEDLLAHSLNSIVNSREALTIIGLVGLAWGASGYYAALDEVMRRIFSGPPRDFIAQRIRGVITVMVLIGLMVGALLLTSIASFVTSVTGQDEIVRILTPLGALVVLVAVVLGIFLLVPTAPPSVRAALPPAVLAGLGIGLLTNLFGLLAPWLIGGLLAFGLIATVFAALIWLNLSYQILLYGAAWARLRRDAEIRHGKAAAAATPYAD